jgi:hypothetical protein
MPLVITKVEFYDREIFHEHEQNLLLLSTTLSSSLNSRHAKRHLEEGFNRRFMMMQTSRLFLQKHTDPADPSIRSTFIMPELNIHLNAYYLNLRGALDNLAWILQYEWQLMPGVTEKNKPQKIGLTAPGFLLHLHRISIKLEAALTDYSSWVKEVKLLRDPAAHRVPIYATPGHVDHNNQVQNYLPIMFLANDDGDEFRLIPDQMFTEHTNFLEISNLVLGALNNATP